MQDYIQDEQERRVLVEWAQLLRARQEAAQAIEFANVRTSLAVTIPQNKPEQYLSMPEYPSSICQCGK